MSIWIIIAALGSIAITAALTWVLWRFNNPGDAAAEPKSGGAVGSNDQAPPG